MTNARCYKTKFKAHSRHIDFNVTKWEKIDKYGCRVPVHLFFMKLLLVTFWCSVKVEHS